MNIYVNERVDDAALFKDFDSINDKANVFSCKRISCYWIIFVDFDKTLVKFKLVPRELSLL